MVVHGGAQTLPCIAATNMRDHVVLVLPAWHGYNSSKPACWLVRLHGCCRHTPCMVATRVTTVAMQHLYQQQAGLLLGCCDAMVLIRCWWYAPMHLPSQAVAALRPVAIFALHAFSVALHCSPTH